MSAVSVRATPKQIASLTGPGRRFIATYGVLVLLAVFCIFLAITQASSFLTASNLSNILVQQSVVALIAMAETCVMITSGIDLSVGAVIGFTGLVAAKIAQHGHNGLAVPLLVALAIGAAIGFIQSLIIVYGKIQPFLVTLAGLGIISGYSLIYSNGYPISGLNHSFDSLGQGSIAGIPYPIVVLVLIALVLHGMLTRTAFGRHLFALGGGEETAVKVGIRAGRVKIAAYTLSGVLAGLGGVLLTAQVDGADPLAGQNLELTAIAAAVIGGTSLFGGEGTILGACAGVILLGVLNNGMDLMNMSTYYQQIAVGVVLLLAVLARRWRSG